MKTAVGVASNGGDFSDYISIPKFAYLILSRYYIKLIYYLLLQILINQNPTLYTTNLDFILPLLLLQSIF